MQSDGLVQVGRPPRRLKSDVTVTLHGGDLGTGRVEDGGGNLGGDLELDRRFEVDIDDPDCDYALTLVIAARDRRLVVEHATVSARPEGPPVTSTGLRTITVDAYLSLVRSELQALGGGFLILRRTQVAPNVVSRSGVGADGWGDFAETQRRRRSTAEALPEVARIYREALGSTDPNMAATPTQHVADRLRYTRGHASRLVAQARSAGLLGKALKGRAGEVPTEGGTP